MRTARPSWCRLLMSDLIRRHPAGPTRWSSLISHSTTYLCLPQLIRSSKSAKKRSRCSLSLSSRLISASATLQTRCRFSSSNLRTLTPMERLNWSISLPLETTCAPALRTIRFHSSWCSSAWEPTICTPIQATRSQGSASSGLRPAFKIRSKHNSSRP